MHFVTAKKSRKFCGFVIYSTAHKGCKDLGMCKGYHLSTEKEYERGTRFCQKWYYKRVQAYWDIGPWSGAHALFRLCFVNVAI